MALLDYFRRRPDGRCEPAGPVHVVDNPPGMSAPRKGTLAAIVGVTAATILFTTIPHDESGRTVEAVVLPDGTAMVKHIRGPQYLKAYLDIAQIPTACDGLTRWRGKPVRIGEQFTEDECGAMLQEALVDHAQGVMRCTPSLAAPGRDYQRAAAVSIGYNIGVGAWCGSSARRAFEQGRFAYGCDRFLPWNKARVRGVLRPVTGLTKRRHREREICLTGLTPDRTPANLAQRIERWK